MSVYLMSNLLHSKLAYLKLYQNFWKDGQIVTLDCSNDKEHIEWLSEQAVNH